MTKSTKKDALRERIRVLERALFAAAEEVDRQADR